MAPKKLFEIYWVAVFGIIYSFMCSAEARDLGRKFRVVDPTATPLNIRDTYGEIVCQVPNGSILIGTIIWDTIGPQHSKNVVGVRSPTIKLANGDECMGYAHRPYLREIK